MTLSPPGNPDPAPAGPSFIHQLRGYPPNSNFIDYFNFRFPNFMSSEKQKMIREIRSEIRSLCKKVRSTGRLPSSRTRLPEGVYRSLFTSHMSSKLRVDEGRPALNVTEHPADLRQGRLEAQIQLGQFTVQSGRVHLDVGGGSGRCKCQIEYSFNLEVQDTPGVTPSEDGPFGWVLSEIFGVPSASPSVTIAKEGITGDVCCD